MASPPPPEDMAETITEQEVILEGDGRAISILVAREDVTVTEGRCPARATIAGPHIHQRHTDAFSWIGGELTFEVGRESEVITISPGGLVAVPPGVAHAFRNDGGRPAHWLPIHAPDGGFPAFTRAVRVGCAACMGGVGDGVEVDWDIAAVPADGGAPARDAIVSRPPSPRG